MAGISRESNGKRIKFQNRGQRKSIWLGKATMAEAETWQRKVEDLVDAEARGRAPKPATMDWLADLAPAARKKLEAVGLVERAEVVREASIADLIDAYKAKKFGSYAARTKANHTLVFKNLETFFGPGRKLADISEGDADDYRDHLIGTRGMNETSTRKDCAVVSKLLRYAKRKRWINENPFSEVPTSNLAGDDFAFIGSDVAGEVLKHLKGTQWPLLFALSRWGGLRVPSDAAALRWKDIDWRGRRFAVWSRKTKRGRVVPLFKELLPLLEARHQAAETGEGDELVLPMLATMQGSSLRKPLLHAIKLAQLDPWPRLWHNLRASRQIDLARDYPAHVVCDWIGNSEAVAQKHYLRTTEDDFAKAIL